MTTPATTPPDLLAGHPDELLTTPEVAAILRLSTKTLENWRWRKEGPPYQRISRRAIFYRRGDLQQWVHDQTVRATDKFAAD
jgi:predicted DNA-binding transcriptional regulator AlpA